MRNFIVFSLIFPLFLLVLPFSPSPAQARWATYDDAPAEVEFYNSDINVDKDGKSVEIVEKQVKILNETGRNSFGVERLHFNENIEKIEIIEAKTIAQGKEHIVPKDMIEIKPLASEIQGFDQLFQILISYPHVGVGTQVYLKYKVTILKQPLPHYFALKYYYGGGAYWKKANFTIKSELPFHILKNDPNDQTDIKKYKDGKYQKLELKSKKPAFVFLMNEASSNQVPDSLMTWINVSTFDKFEDFSKACAKDFEEVVSQDLPPLQEEIRKKAAPISHLIDLINSVTSQLSEKIRYMGDWRTVEGRFSPRPLKDVAKSGVGDCKDFAASTVAILRALGYKAQVAVVTRGMSYLPPEKSLPSFSEFNHAIVKVTASDGKVLWIDPTNFTSMADGVYPDISDRPVLVLDSKEPSYENVPSINPQHSKISVENSIEIKEDDVLKTEGILTFMGESAQDFTGAGLSQSLQSIEESIIKHLSEEASPTKKKVTLPPLDSRIVKDFKIYYGYEQEKNLLLTNSGPGILLKYMWSQPFIDTSEDQEGTSFMGLPVTYTKKTIFKDVGIELAAALAYEFHTPWVEAKRECRVIDHGLEMNETISVLKSFVSAKDIKSKPYKELKKAIKKYCNKIAVIVTSKEAKKTKEDPLAKGG